jgi:hypothetical protein
MFDKHDDRSSSQEAPLTTGFYMDASGNSWGNRPDNLIQSYMSKVAITRDEYWQYKKHLDNREWFELDLFLERIAKKVDADGQIRVNKARNVIKRVNLENRDGE